MKNMTVTESNHDWYVIGSDGKIIPWDLIPHALYGALCKLHDYEKSGLTPELLYNLMRAQHDD